jgi:hypothetical protein
MLQDAPIIVLFVDSKFSHLQNEDIFNSVQMGWVYTLENTFNSCYKVNSTVPFSKTFFFLEPIKTKDAIPVPNGISS